MADAQYSREAETVEVVVENAAAIGELREGANGRAEWMQGATAAIAGNTRVFTDVGKVLIPKPAGITILNGGRVFWNRTNRTANFKRANNRDFYAGTAVGDAAADATSMVIDLNKWPRYQFTLLSPYLTTEATNGLGVTELAGGAQKLAFDAVAEAAQAAIYSDILFDVASNPIMEGIFVVDDKGDDAALDFDLGLASGSHATDFEAITAFASVHFDGNSVNIGAQSDDGTTDVAIADTLIDFILGTPVEVWVDARNRDNVKIYLNAVRVLESTLFKFTAAAGPLKPIALMEKTNNDTTGVVRVLEMMVRTSEQ